MKNNRSASRDRQGEPTGLRPTVDRNRAVTGRERKSSVIFSTCSSGERLSPERQPHRGATAWKCTMEEKQD
jgi:hypothetical protein